MLDRMSEYMSDGMSEFMSDKRLGSFQIENQNLCHIQCQNMSWWGSLEVKYFHPPHSKYFQRSES